MRGEIFQNGLEGDHKGYAWVRVILDPEDQAEFSEDDSVAIGRYEAASLEFLQATGGDNWTGAPAPLKLVEPPRIAGNYADFLLQPAYVDQLSDMPYEICLVGKNGEVKGKAPSVYFDNVQYSPLKGTNTVQSYEPEEKAPRDYPSAAAAGAAAVAGTAAAASAAEPGDIAEPSDAQAEAQYETSPGNYGGAPESQAGAYYEQPLNMDGAQQPHQGEYYPPEYAVQPQYQEQAPYPDYMRPRKSGAFKWVIVAIVILLLAGGAGAGYYFYKDQILDLFAKKETPEYAAETGAKASQDEEKGREDAAGAGAQASQEDAKRREDAERRAREMAEKARQADTVARVNQFFAGQRDPVSAMHLAQELPKETSPQQDAIFRLYYYAAQSGDPEAMRLYAESIDPSRPAWGTIKKDGAEAWDYYGRLPDGEADRARLKEWTENQARTGNSAARDWLNSME